MSDGRPTGRDGGAISPPARLDLFGFHPTPARLVLIPRSGAWRSGHAFGLLLLCWAAIGVVMWVPPHIPWVLGAFFLGIFFFVKYIRERNTLVELDGTCPRCGAAQTLRKPTRLGNPHRVYCPKCRQTLLLRTTEPHSAP